ARRDILALARAPTTAVPASLVRQAVRELAQREDREVVPVLTARLRDPDASIRFQAATALRRIGDRAATTGLLAAASEHDPSVRFAVFTALNRLGRSNPQIWPRLVGALDSSDPFVRETMSFALRETFDFSLVQALTHALDRMRPVSAREVVLRLLAALHHQ